MSVLLQLQNAHKRYGEQDLLHGASCALSDEQKVGLIGRNGSGKSTLCQVLLGDESLDSGDVVRGRKLRLGYLRQHNPFQDGETVLDFLMRDSGQAQWRCGEVAWQFQLPDTMLYQPVSDLSGGWQTRVKLAALLLHDPNLLILDEPTNFLDLRTQMLLEDFLKNFRGGCLVVSHDRAFLKRSCTHTLELSRGQLTMFPGNVDAYLENLALRRAHDRRANVATATKRKQLETFINKNRANANTASQARSKTKQLERLQMIDIAGDEPDVRFHFPQISGRQGTALRINQLAIGYPTLAVATDIQIEVEHGQRVGIVGDNGQGKTTFLRTLCGSIVPLEGKVEWGFGCTVGVYAQHVYTTLPEKQTVADYLQDQATPGTTAQKVKDVAGSFLFSGELIEKRIRVLSGGERARLVLAGLLLGQHNVLVLDEPGNHLDVESVEALATALEEFQGTVLFTSHDRHFMHRVATAVVEVSGGRVASYPASYDDYVYRVQKELEEGLRAEHAAYTTGAGALPVTHKKIDGRKERQLQKQLRSIERKIQRGDDQKHLLHESLLAVTSNKEAEQIRMRMNELEISTTKLEEEWLETSALLEQ